jgi:hypothetical protein
VNGESQKFDNIAGTIEGVEVIATQIQRFQPLPSFICMLDIELVYVDLQLKRWEDTKLYYKPG